MTVQAYEEQQDEEVLFLISLSPAVTESCFSNTINT